MGDNTKFQYRTGRAADTPPMVALIGGVDVNGVVHPMGVNAAGVSPGEAGVQPAANGAAISPNDTTDLPNATRGIYVGGAGDVKVNFLTGGSGITLKAVPVGSVLPVQVSRVYNTGTTATNLVALY